MSWVAAHLVQRLEYAAAILQPLEGNALGERQVLDLKLRVVRVGLDDERIRSAAEIGGVVEQVVGPAPQVGHGDVRGHAGPPGAAQPGHGRAHRGPALNGVVGGVEGGALEAGQHPVVALGVVARAVVDRAEHGETVHQPGLLGQQFTELDPRYTRADGPERAAVSPPARRAWGPRSPCGRDRR